MTRAYGTSRPDVMEVFPSSPVLPRALEQAGWLIGDPAGYEGPLSGGFCAKGVDRLLNERPGLELLSFTRLANDHKPACHENTQNSFEQHLKK